MNRLYAFLIVLLVACSAAYAVTSSVIKNTGGTEVFSITYETGIATVAVGRVVGDVTGDVTGDISGDVSTPTITISGATSIVSSAAATAGGTNAATASLLITANGTNYWINLFPIND